LAEAREDAIAGAESEREHEHGGEGEGAEGPGDVAHIEGDEDVAEIMIKVAIGEAVMLTVGEGEQLLERDALVQEHIGVGGGVVGRVQKLGIITDLVDQFVHLIDDMLESLFGVSIVHMFSPGNGVEFLGNIGQNLDCPFLAYQLAFEALGHLLRRREQ